MNDGSPKKPLRKVFIVNPVAHRYPRNIRDLIFARFPGAEVRFTEWAGHAASLARATLDEFVHEDVGIVACGGDGTFREIATAVGESATLGLVPMGTVNLVARQLGIPLDPGKALSLVEKGNVRNVFAGRCVAGSVDTVFFIGVSAGPDADAVHAAGSLGKRFLGRYVYLVHFLRRMVRPVPADIPFCDDHSTGRCGQLYVLNMPEYAGPYRFSPNLSLFEPGLEMAPIREGRGALVRFIWRIFRGRTNHGTSLMRPITKVEFEPPGRRFQIDGDPFFADRVTVALAPKVLRVIAASPQTSDSS